jgi:hypothetical protein
MRSTTYRYSLTETTNRLCYISRGDLYDRSVDKIATSIDLGGTNSTGLNAVYDLTEYQTFGDFDYSLKAFAVQSNISFGYDPSTPNYATPVFDFLDYNYTWLGLLGIDAKPVNYTSGPSAEWVPKPSLLEQLRSANVIPSRSWGYTAGSYNRKR